MLKEGAQEGLWTYCYPELSCTEKENSGNSSVKYRVQKMVNNGPQDTVVVIDYVSTQLQQENARKMRNRIRKKLFAAKLPGTILGTVLAAKVSTEVFIKISTAVSIFSYNLFFWMGAQCYDLGEMENDTADKNNSGETEDQDDTADENESGETGEQDNESVASLVAHRLDSNYNSASMLWLLLQFLLLGMMKGILEEGLEEFLRDHLDSYLQVKAVCDIADSVGNFLSMILTAASPSSWVGSDNDISKSHLDNYYRMLAIITLSSTFLFTIVAIAYELRTKEDTAKSGKKG
ncbi:hypothetical protein SLEP1_g44293 [Rubroshorea leprosula]|nr:hypothetical protein SLEP1_g44293 [Rubroshorea leprosula]